MLSYNSIKQKPFAKIFDVPSNQYLYWNQQTNETTFDEPHSADETHSISPIYQLIAWDTWSVNYNIRNCKCCKTNIFYFVAKPRAILLKIKPT